MRTNGFRYLRNSTLIAVGAAALAFACEGAPSAPTPTPIPIPDLAETPPVPDLAVLPPDLASYPAPIVSSVVPSTGANNTTTVISVIGQNFRQGATVTVGGMPCTSPVVLSPTSIACTVPARAGTCAAQNVVVTHPDDMKSGTGSNLFSYRTGTLGFVVGAPAIYATGAGPRRIVSADLNGDGKVDLATSNQSNNVTVFLNTGASFAATNYNTTIPGSSLAAGDISGDGKVDLVVGQANAANVIALINNAAGTGVYTVGPARSVAGTVSDVALTDLNGDGSLDLVAVNGSVGSVSLAMGMGAGAFAAPTNVAVGATPTGVAVVDLDGDKKMDLVVANGGGSSVSILRGAASGGVSAAVNVAVGTTRPDSVFVADLDNDGQPDIVTSNGSTSNMNFLRSSSAIQYVLSQYTTGTNPLGITVADFNKDGFPDIAVAATGSNQAQVFLQTCK